MSLIADEVAQVAVLHVGQDHQWGTLRRQADSQQRENVGVAEVLHDDPLLQELGHLLQICDAFKEKKKRRKQKDMNILEMKKDSFHRETSRDSGELTSSWR